MLVLVLHKGDFYIGHLSANFDLSDLSDNLFLDFEGKEILFYTCNGNIISAKENFLKRRVKIPKIDQRIGKNAIKIAYKNRYSTDGNGLHHFVDPEDKEEYLYSNFEPFAANKMFPCFDQPNLKAMFKLITISPKNWVVIGNERVKSTLSIMEARRGITELNLPTELAIKA